VPNFRILTSLLALLLFSRVALADVICDGVDDDMDTGVAISNFLSVSAGTMMLWYKPTGTASAGVPSPDCYFGEYLLGNMEDSGATYVGISRNGNISSTDRLCVYNDSGSFQQILSTYTVDVWTHLAWVHTGGNLLMYKDGAQVSSTSSGDTESLANKVRLCNGAPAFAAMGEGVIGHASIFSTGLSAGEIAAIAGSRLHRIASSAPSADWEFGSCSDGASCDTQTFADRSGNGRTLTAAGTTGAASAFITYPWGVE
jgi:hypothetical protein